MLTKRVIPCLDVRNGRLTKGVKFVGNEDIGDPVETARQYYEAGADEIVFYDITASAEARGIFLDVVEKVASEIFIPFSVGGGISTVQDMRAVLLAGAEKISVNSAAVKNPEMFTSWISKFGSEKIILGADAKEKKIAISGWEETTSQELIPFIKGYYDKGITKVICTDIARDGMLQGPAIDLYKEIRDEIPFLYIIASGGVSSIEDIEKLSEAGIPAVIFGKAIYEGKIQLKDLLRFT